MRVQDRVAEQNMLQPRHSERVWAHNFDHWLTLL